MLRMRANCIVRPQYLAYSANNDQPPTSIESNRSIALCHGVACQQFNAKKYVVAHPQMKIKLTKLKCYIFGLLQSCENTLCYELYLSISLMTIIYQSLIRLYAIETGPASILFIIINNKTNNKNSNKNNNNNKKKKNNNNNNNIYNEIFK